MFAGRFDRLNVGNALRVARLISLLSQRINKLLPAMKRLLLLLSLVYSVSLPAQSTDTLITYLDQNRAEVAENSPEKVYLQKVFPTEDSLWQKLDYYLSTGNLKSSSTYLTPELQWEERVGESLYYFENGQLKSRQFDASDGKATGRWESFYESGELRVERFWNSAGTMDSLKSYFRSGNRKRLEIYDDAAEMTTGVVWDSLGIEQEFYSFETMPEFPGGVAAMFSFISNNMKYPRAAKRRNISGRVVIGFVIETDGRIVDVRVVRSAHELLDREGMRIVQQMPNWLPGRQDGEPVRVSYNLPLTFKLERP